MMTTMMRLMMTRLMSCSEVCHVWMTQTVYWYYYYIYIKQEKNNKSQTLKEGQKVTLKIQTNTM